MSMSEFSRELYSSAFSTSLRSVEWLVPLLQSSHIVAIACLFGAVLVMELRLLGILAKDQTPQGILQRYFPWQWVGLSVLVITGLLMTIAEPNRVLSNSIFWSKMGLVVLAVILTWLFKMPIKNARAAVDNSRTVISTKLLALVSLGIWITVIFCGRWIAYAG